MTEPDHHTRIIALEALNQLDSARFQEVLFRYDMPTRHLPINAPQTEQAIKLIQYAQQKGADGLYQLIETIRKAAPHLDISVSTPPENRPSVFLPLPSVLKLGKLGPLFDNQLVYFTPAEHHDIIRLCDTLQQERIVLLQGQPAKGKTVTAFAAARRMEEAGWQVYYHSFKTNTLSCWPDIESYLYRKFLFILDDCHLNTEALSDIYARIHDLNRTAALLCIARPVAENLQESLNYDFNVFAALREVTFAAHECDTAKIAGITAARQHYYQQHGGDYRSGDAAKLAAKVYGNLVTLSFYLEHWQRTRDLEQVNDAQVLTGIYAQYFKPLDKRSSECLVQYACLFCFEIEFEALPEYEQETEKLAESGIIEHQREHIYSFYHSDFANLLLRAYAAHDGTRFVRQYKTLDNFIVAKIKVYLLAFKEKYHCPDITHTVLMALTKTIGNTVLEKLLSDDEINTIFMSYYKDETSGSNIAQFIHLLSRLFPNIFNSYFEILVNENPLFYTVIFEDNRSFGIYTVTLINLKKTPEVLQRFLELWGDKKGAVIEKAHLTRLSLALLTWKRKINRQEAEDLLTNITIESLLGKLEQADFQAIGKALNELKLVNADKAAALFAAADNPLLLGKLEQANFQAVGKALNELKLVNADKAAALFAAADDNILLGKLEQADFQNIGNALNELKLVNSAKAAALFASADDTLLLGKLAQANFQAIGRALNELKLVNSAKAAALFAAADDTLLLGKLEQTDFANIGNALNELKLVNPDKAAALYDKTDISTLTEKVLRGRLGFIQIAAPFSQLRQINPEKTQAVFNSVKISLPVDNWIQEIPRIPSQYFIYSFGVFTNLDPVFTKNILKQLPETYLLQQKALLDTLNYNRLLYGLWLCGFTSQDTLIKKLLKFAQDNLSALLSDKSTRNTGSFLRILNNYMPIKPILYKEYKRLIGKMLYEQDKIVLPKYIAIMHEIDETSGFDFLQTLQKRQPELIEQFGFTHLYIAQNYQKQSNAPKAAKHFSQAEQLLRQINHAEGLTLLEKARQGTFSLVPTLPEAVKEPPTRV